MVGLFLALLELMRMHLVRIEQEATFETIYVFPLTDEEPEAAVARALSATETHREPSESTERDDTEQRIAIDEAEEISDETIGDETLEENNTQDHQDSPPSLNSPQNESLSENDENASAP